jgi:UDP-3-O-[3-hydroxymyristoyl] glucosamine N-acyltransferase
MSLQDLAASVGGQLAAGADGSLPIHGAAAVGEAQQGEVTFLGNAKYLPALKRSQASAVLVPADFTEPVPATAIYVADPSSAFSKVVERFAPEPVRYAPGVHPTAVIGADVSLGDGVSVQPYAVIERGAVIGAGSVVGAHCFIGQESRIGADCFLHPRVTVAGRCVLGDRVAIQSGTVIGSDGFGYEFRGGKHVKIP